MSYGDMASLMQMDDTHRFGKVMLDRVEWHDSGEGGTGAWDAQGWYGGDTNKLWLKTEGERVAGVTHDARIEFLFDRVVARWWDAQAGIRQDFGHGPARTWLALGLEGLAPLLARRGSDPLCRGRRAHCCPAEGGTMICCSHSASSCSPTRR